VRISPTKIAHKRMFDGKHITTKLTKATKEFFKKVLRELRALRCKFFCVSLEQLIHGKRITHLH
jgi:hypothetical protein